MALANTLTVANGNDSGPGSLRATIADANDGDIIVVPARLYTITGPQIVIGKRLTIVGAGAPTTEVDRTAAAPDNGPGRIFEIDAAVYIIGMTFTGGENRSPDQAGGALYVAPGASLELVESAVVANKAVYGGGIEISGGSAMIIRSTIVHNSDQISGFYGGTGHGGGIEVDGNGTLDLDTSTVVANQVGSTGGGIEVAAGSFSPRTRAEVTFSTITNNTAQEGGNLDVDTRGGGPTSPVAVSGTIIANGRVTASSGSGTGNCYRLTSGSAQPPTATAGYNLEDHNECGFSRSRHDLINTPAGLAPLGFYGGFTDTEEPTRSSAAIDNGGPSCGTWDQRRFSRPYGPACDIGAVEAHPPWWLAVIKPDWELLIKFIRGVRVSFIPRIDGTDSLTLEVPTRELTRSTCKPHPAHHCPPPMTIVGRANGKGRARSQTSIRALLDTEAQNALKKGRTLSITALLTYRWANGKPSVLSRQFTMKPTT